VVLGAAAFVGLLAQVSIPLPHTPVPLTGQTLGVLVAGASLGTWRATLSMSLYVLAGLAGVPWFHAHTSGYPGVTFGYLLGFVAAAAIMGEMSRRGLDRHVASAVLQFVVGSLVIYLFGVTWLAQSAHLSVAQALSFGMKPFLVGDAVKALLAGALVPATWRLIGRP
jgi:biotin transport system substrate-specific component